VIRHALAEALGVVEVKAAGPTWTWTGRRALLHCTKRAIYDRRRRGKMPRPLTKKPLVWKTADVLAMRG
jgi:hypothetical protein